MSETTKDKQNSRNQIAFVKQVYDNLQDMISLADSKANMSISIQSLLITIGVGASLLINTVQNLQKLDDILLICIFILLISVFIISSFIGIVFSILVYCARSPVEESEKKREGLLYFGHITSFSSSKEYLARIKDLNENKILEEFSFQAYNLSNIAKTKMKLINCSVWFLLVNIILTIVLLMFSGYVSSITTI